MPETTERIAQTSHCKATTRTTSKSLGKQINEIKKNIKQIKEIEGNDGLLGPSYEVQYLIWQAELPGDKADREMKRLQARAILSELRRRRGDWAFIPLALAKLEEQELLETLKQSSAKEITAKEETIIDLYQQAIKLGQRDSAIVRQTAKLLLKNGRSADAVELLRKTPGESQFAKQLAFEKRDFQRAAQIAREAIAGKPDDFQEWLWLVRILLDDKRPDEAENELRKAVALFPKDPDRWIALTSFMVFTAKNLPEAENVVHEAEVQLPSAHPRAEALAQCCENDGASLRKRGHRGQRQEVV